MQVEDIRSNDVGKNKKSEETNNFEEKKNNRKMSE